MTPPLDVLVLESRRGAAAGAARDLARAGHRVHRCHDPADDGFPCLGLADGECPLDGHVDVAVLARDGGGPQPTPLEDGVSCALRAGVPVVEAGPADDDDPFAEWLTARAEPGADLVATTEHAAEQARQAMSRTILTVVAPLLADAGISPRAARCTVAPQGRALHVRIDVPTAVDEGLQNALAVRALAALGSERRTHDSIGISVNGPVGVR